MGSDYYFDSQRFLDEFNAKDAKAHRAFHDAYWPRMYAFALRITQEREEARDQVQEAFVELFRAEPRPWKSLRQIESFLYKATRNGCLNAVEKRKNASKRAKVYSSQFKEHTSQEDTEYAIMEGKLMAAIAQTLPSLPEENRLVWKLLFEEQKSYREAATILNISEDLVKYRRSALVKKFRARLSNQDFADIVAGCTIIACSICLLFRGKF